MKKPDFKKALNEMLSKPTSDKPFPKFLVIENEFDTLTL